MKKYRMAIMIFEDCVYANTAFFLGTLAKCGRPRILSYDAEPPESSHRAAPLMVLEWTAQKNAVKFAKIWFDEPAKNVKKHIHTVTS